MKWADVKIYELTGMQPERKSRDLLLLHLLLLLTHQLKVRGAQPSPALSYTLCYINAASQLCNLSGDFIDPLRCYISDYLFFFLSFSPPLHCGKGWGGFTCTRPSNPADENKELHNPQQRWRQQKHLLSLYQPKSFVTTFELFLPR